MPLAWRREGQAYAYPGCCTASVRSTAIYTIIASSAAVNGLEPVAHAHHGEAEE